MLLVDAEIIPPQVRLIFEPIFVGWFTCGLGMEDDEDIATTCCIRGVMRNGSARYLDRYWVR